MLGLETRALRIVWTVFLFALLVLVVYLIRRTLIVFVLALFLAQLLAPLVDWVEQYVPDRISRPVALAVVYLLFLGAMTAILIPVGSTIGEQAATLALRLPDTIKQDPLGSIPLPSWLEQIRPQLTQVLRDRVQDLGSELLPLLSQASASVLSGIGNVLSVILIPILSFFFLKDGSVMRVMLVDALPLERRNVLHDILGDLRVLLAQYIRALVLLSLSTFVSHTVLLSVIGVPYAILLASVAALLEFIPVAGPLVAGATILLVSAFTGYPHLLWIALFLVVFRLFQDYVLNPHLMAKEVEIHPVLVLFGVLAGEQIAGIPGMFFSVPLMAALRVVVVRLRKAHAT
jgi:predicted PurR-regulated permease PerM